jgi:hypothetical protein
MLIHRLTISLAVFLGVIVLLAGCKKDPAAPSLEDVDPETVVFLSDFNSENGGQGALNWTGFEDWNVVSGCVDLHGNGFWDVWPNNGLYVDMDGTCMQGGTIETKDDLVLSPGHYVLEFWLAGNNRRVEPDTVLVNFGAFHEEQIVLQRRDPFRLFSREFNVTAKTAAKLSFQNLGGDDAGALLDLVRVRRVQ